MDHLDCWTFQSAGSPVSVGVCKWSADNRIAYCTEQSIGILTIRITRGSGGKRANVATDQTLIPITSTSHDGDNNDDAEEGFKETMDTADQFQSVCWSPANTSLHGGCLLLSLSLHGTLKIYSPISYCPSGGSYEEVFTIQGYAGDGDGAHPSISAADWSPLCGKEYSFIALGSSAGNLALYRFISPRYIQLVAAAGTEQSTSDVGKDNIASQISSLQSICTLKWSRWVNECSAYLVSASVDGAVTLWYAESSAGQLKLRLVRKLMESDGRAATVIEWCPAISGSLLDAPMMEVAIGKLGGVHLFQLASPSSPAAESLADDTAFPVNSYYCRIDGCISMVPVSVTWSPDGQQFTTITADGRCRVFERSQNSDLFSFNSNGEACLQLIRQIQRIPRSFLAGNADDSTASHNQSTRTGISADKISLQNNIYGVRVFGSAVSIGGMWAAMTYRPFHKTDFGYTTEKSDITYCDLFYCGGDQPANRDAFTRLNRMLRFNHRLFVDYTTDTVLLDYLTMILYSADKSELAIQLLKVVCDSETSREMHLPPSNNSLYAANYFLANLDRLPVCSDRMPLKLWTVRLQLISAMEKWLVMGSGGKGQAAVNSDQRPIVSLLLTVQLVLLKFNEDLELVQLATQCIQQLLHERFIDADGQPLKSNNLQEEIPRVTSDSVLALFQRLQSAQIHASYRKTPSLARLTGLESSSESKESIHIPQVPDLITQATGQESLEICPACQQSDLQMLFNDSDGIIAVCQGASVAAEREELPGETMYRHRFERCCLTLLAIDNYWRQGRCNACGAVAELPPLDPSQFSICSDEANRFNRTRASALLSKFASCPDCGGGRFAYSG